MPIPPYTIPYDPHFLGRGINVPLPKPSDALRAKLHVVGRSPVIDYIHFSLAMHADRHTAVFSACNIDGSRIVKGAGGVKTWKLDDRLGNFQLGAEAYAGTAWDKGHLTKREDVVWGPPKEAKYANESTFYYANAAPQHENFNRDEWKALEDWIFGWASEDEYRLSVITGPVLKRNDRRLSEGDPELRAIRDEILDPEHIFIPAAYWKIVALRHKDSGELTVAAFAMRQTDLWDDLEGHKLLRLNVHQVTVDAISRWSDLDFGPLHDADVLRVGEERALVGRDAVGDAIWPIIKAPSDIIAPPSGGELRTLRPAAERKPAPCGCGDVEADLREAVASLTRDVARLTETVATLLPAGTAERMAAPAPERALPGTEPLPAGPGTAPAAPAPATEAAPPEDVDRVLELLRFDARSADLVRIVGGEEVPEGELLSTCCIGSFAQFFCSGVLVHPQVVVTAAHCGADITKAFFGGPNIPTLGGDGTVIRVRKAVVHPQYNKFAVARNDINVLILDEPSDVEPTPIATAKEIAAATLVELAGFGYNDAVGQLGFGTKRRVIVPMAAVRKSAGQNLSVLEAKLGFASTQELVAGRKRLGKDSCNGDSGGPAFITVGNTRKVAGVTSRATREATTDMPCGSGGIYVRLDVFRDWIVDVARQFGITM